MLMIGRLLLDLDFMRKLVLKRPAVSLFDFIQVIKFSFICCYVIFCVVSVICSVTLDFLSDM